MGVEPKFYILDRIRISDRLLVLLKTDRGTGINFVGCDMPIFYSMPSCFCLKINNLWFVNISNYGLFQRRIGFPYQKEPNIVKDGFISGDYTQGMNRTMLPLLKKRFPFKGTKLYQPIFHQGLAKPEFRHMFESEYVKSNSLNWELGIGKVFMARLGGLKEYPIDKSDLWIPSVNYDLQEMMFDMQIYILEWQLYIHNMAPKPLKKQNDSKKWLTYAGMIRKHTGDIITALRENKERLTR